MATIAPNQKIRRSIGWSNLRCMKYRATRKNFTTIRKISSGTATFRDDSPNHSSHHSVLTSSAVSTTSTQKIVKNWPSVGPWCASCSASVVWPARSAVGVLMPGSSGDQVDDGEDQDPHDVDEVPVEADHLDGLGVDPPAERQPRRHEQHDHARGDVHPVQA